MEWCCPLEGGSSHFSELNLEMPLQTYLEICLHFNFILVYCLFILCIQVFSLHYEKAPPDTEEVRRQPDPLELEFPDGSEPLC